MQSLVILCLVSFAAASPMLQARQSDAVSVNGWSSTVIRSTTTVTSTRTEYTVTTIHTEPWESVYEVTHTVGGSVEVHPATITLYPSGTVDDSAASEDATDPSYGKRDGAIAGGVIGAVVVAGIAVILFMRFRNKRSPKHWRNRDASAGRWHSLDGKTAAGSSGQSLDVKTAPSPVLASIPSPTPAVPLFLREKHGRTPSNPFEDPSMAQYSSSSNGPQTPRAATYFEMEPTSPK